MADPRSGQALVPSNGCASPPSSWQAETTNTMVNLLVAWHQMTFIPTNFPAAFADGLQTLLPVPQGTYASVESDVLPAKVLQAEELHGTSLILV